MPKETETKNTESVETQEVPDAEEQAFDVNEIIEPVSRQINERMDTISQDLQSRTEQMIADKFQQLRGPEEDVSGLFGGTPSNPNRSPHGRRGEDPLTSRHYSVGCLWAAMHPDSTRGPEHAKVEYAIHRQLKSYFQERDFPSSGAGCIMVPFGASLLPDDIDSVEDKETDRLSRDELGEIMTSPISLQRMRAVRQQMSQALRGWARQALSIFDDTGLGIFTDATLSGELIELVRAQEVFSRIGAREITLPPNGALAIASQTGGATGNWVGEATTISTSEPTTGAVRMRAKKAAAMNVIPNELFRFSTRDTEAFLRMDLTRVLALLVDLAGLEGVGGTNEPLGILNHDNIVTKTAGTTAANGDTLEPTDPSGAKAEVEENDHDIDGRGFAWLMRGKMWQNILNRRAAAISSGDQEGAFLFAVNREDIRNGQPPSLEGHPVIKSGQISNTRSKGSSSDLTYILGGIPDDVIIGRIGVLEFSMATEGTVNSNNLFETDQAALRAIEHADFAMRHENSWVLIDSLDMDLPSGVI